MLNSLEIKDYALIENIHVEFGPGLNIITGETGAGKSILIGALGLLLGERASSEAVRKGAAKSYVEGIFNIGTNEKVKKYLSDNNFEFSEELIIRREISVKGSNRCFINDSPVQLSHVKEVGDLLIDLHGQHDHQSLLRTETHIDFLDEFCRVNDILDEFKAKRKILLDSINELNTLKKNEKEIKNKLELNSFQLKEINAVSPEKDEDSILERELKIMENAEKLFDSSSQIHSAIYEDENCAHDLLVSIQNSLNSISRIDESLKGKADEINSAVQLVRDVGDFIRDYRDKIDIDPNLLEEKRERAGAIYLLKKKYGGTLESVLSHRNKIEEELSIAENFGESIKNLEKKIDSIRMDILKIGLNLSSIRKKEARKIEKSIEEALSYLGINDSKFVINISFNESLLSDQYVEHEKKRVSIFPNGLDEVEFYISTNKGEDPKPLVKTASGGEVSRIMLAIKSVMAKTEKLPLLVFDEIDVGISGRIAQKVGKVLKNLSVSHQIISITHLPQIAAFADHNYSVTKKSSADRTISMIQKLNNDEKVNEIAKLLSGEKVTDNNRKNAQDLIDAIVK